MKNKCEVCGKILSPSQIKINKLNKYIKLLEYKNSRYLSLLLDGGDIPVIRTIKKKVVRKNGMASIIRRKRRS